jgi:cytochrome P450
MSDPTIPEAPGATLTGHAHLFRDDRLAVFRSLAATGELATIRFLHRSVVFANTPRAARVLLVEQAKRFEKSPGIRLLLFHLAGEGLFTAEGELWRRQRRLMAPLFQPAALSQYHAAMAATARRAVQSWADGQSLDLASEMTRVTMGVVGKTLFDSDTFDEADALGHCLTVALAWVNTHSADPGVLAQVELSELVNSLGERVPEGLKPAVAKARQALREPFLVRGTRDPALRDAIAQVERRIQQMIDERRAAGLTRNDLLTRLLAARDEETPGGATMTDKQVRDEAVTLFVAGHETTATALAWAFYLLGRHPEARQRVQAEADAYDFDTHGYDPAALAYTTQVFKETLRLYPPVVVLPRHALGEVDVVGHRVPTDTLMFVSPWIVHRDPAHWPDPERFDPDRFTPEAEAARDRHAWIPFGAGPRVCIGNHFALMEGALVLAEVMKRARVEVDPTRTIVEDQFATLRPKGGVPARVFLRAGT